jgi:class 3 adenylate cyclase
MAVCIQCGAALPPDARFCPACAAPVEVAASEERKLATILFADLVGSTELAGDQDPERTRAVLDSFYDAMSAEIEGAGGTVEKFVGDAVMAAFGAPAAQEDHAERALHAALAMQRRLADLFGDRLALRIGVNTGEVVVGRAREGSSFVSGDAVNVGARLEQAAAPGEILAGERTVTSAGGAFEFTEPSRIEAKGKPAGIECRRVVRALSLMRPRGIRDVSPVFVGREAELELLQAAYERISTNGEPHLVTIIGDAGVGKTRLVRELWGWLSGQSPEPIRRTGRCLSYGQGITYWPLGEVLKEHFEILEDDSPETAALRLGSERAFLGMTLGLAAEEDLHPLVARERLHDAWISFLDELVAERPSVVLIEDLHWAEDDLFDLLESLLEHVKGPLLLLTTARPELLDRRPGWRGSRRNASALRLEALSSQDTGRLLNELIRVELPDSLRDVLVTRAEGNPFFAEELIASLIDIGVLHRRNGSWSIRELPAGFHVPDTVQAVLSARIDLLPPAEKAALQAASVIGRVFWTAPVYELAEGFFPDLDLLEERDFVRRRSGSSLVGEREYVIKHALTREVAYASLPKAKRAQLHAAFATWLERTGEGRDEHASLLAHHYTEAVRPEDLDLAWSGRGGEVDALREKAVGWSRRAADLAVGRYEIDEGLAILQRAVELEQDPRQQAELWQKIGRANALKYDGEAFLTAMQNAIDLGGESADLYAELALQTAERAGMWIREPDFTVFDRWVEQALALAEPESPARAKALAARAMLRDDEAAALAAQEIAEQLGDAELRSLALAGIASARCGVGDFADACAKLEERLELLDEIGDPDHHHHVHLWLAQWSMGVGRFSEARRAADLLEATVEGLTPHHRVHGVGTRVDIEVLSGRWDAACRLTPRAEQVIETNLATPCPFNVAALLECAVANFHQGDAGEARRLEAKANAIGMEGYRHAFDPPRIWLAIARGDHDELRRIVDSMEAEQFEPWVYYGLSAFLDALIALGDRERIEAEAPQRVRPDSYVEPFALRALGFAREDESLLDDAAARFETMGLDWHAAETRKLLS